MRFITQIETRGEESVSQAQVSAESPGATAGWIRSGYLIEIAAQAVAAHQGQVKSTDAQTDKNISGMLTAVRHWRQQAAVRAETTVEVLVQPLAALGNAAQFRTTIRQDGHLVADGTLQVIRTLIPDPEIPTASPP